MFHINSSMGNKIFQEIFKQRVEIFKTDFSQISQKLFYDESTKKLIHPGEFGMYRENICKEFLKYIIPFKLEIDSGFIINTNGKISTQCDLVLYDKGSTPIIRSLEYQKFFPIETVSGIVEVKSILSKTDLKEALIKLANTKILRDDIDNSDMISLSGRPTLKFDPINNIQDQIYSLLICNKLDFELESLVDDFKNIYGDIEQRYWHNMILSLEDGLVLYSDSSEEKGVPCPYPVFRRLNLPSMMILPSIDHPNDPFLVFAAHVSAMSQGVVIQIVNMFKYLLEENHLMNVRSEDVTKN